MKSVAAPTFWARYRALPADVQRLADKNYQLWSTNPRHRSLYFKPIHDAFWSVRVGLHYRAIGKFVDGETFLWVWIGTHEEYDKL